MNELASGAAGRQTGGCKIACGTALKKLAARPFQNHDPHCGTTPNPSQTTVTAGLKAPFTAVKTTLNGTGKQGLAPMWCDHKTRELQAIEPLKYVILHNLFLDYGNRTRPQTQYFSVNVLSEFN